MMMKKKEKLKSKRIRTYIYYGKVTEKTTKDGRNYSVRATKKWTPVR